MKRATKQTNPNGAKSKRVTGSRSVKTADASGGPRRFSLEAEGILIVGEDASEFDEFATKLIEHFEPVGPVEQELVERVISQSWRLKRVPRLEAAVIAARDAATAKDSPAQQNQERRDHLAEMASRYLPKGKPAEDAGSTSDAQEEQEKDVQKQPEKKKDSSDPEEAIGRALIHDSENGNVLGQVGRYEASLTNTLDRTLRMLERRQSSRNEPEPKEMPK